MSPRIVAGAYSNAGRREQNEDAVRTIPELGLYIVADATGGRAGGATAAEEASEVISRELSNALGSGRATDAVVERAIDAAVQRAHLRIRERQKDPALHGMATTVVVLAVTGARLHVAWVGDSRAYLFHQGQLSALTRDHSLENYLADNPTVVPKVKRPGNTLVRALGLVADMPKVDHKHLDLDAGDVVLGCSDGVYAALPDWMLSAILASVRPGSEQEVAETLVRASIAQGSMDNSSAVLLRVLSEDAIAPRTLGWLTFLEGPRQGHVIALGASTDLGNDSACDVAVDDGGAAPRHARIRATETGFALRDLGSGRGTFLNEKPVEQVELVDADVIRLGGTRIVFKCHRV